MFFFVMFPSAGNWGGNSSGQSNNGTNNTQQWNSSQRPPTSQADSKYLTEVSDTCTHFF